MYNLSWYTKTLKFGPKQKQCGKYFKCTEEQFTLQLTFINEKLQSALIVVSPEVKSLMMKKQS